MKQKILNKSCELFLNKGFKSVTMDDIANEIGASKKTLYTHYENKTALVEAVTNELFDIICNGIDHIYEQGKNPIQELLEIKQFVMSHLKDEKSSPQYQLQKYYPKIYKDIKIKQFEYMQRTIKSNLEAGLSQNLYRKCIDIEFVSRFYFYGMIAIKDQELFPSPEFSQRKLMDEYLEYHLRGICTEKGIQFLETQLK